MKKVFLIYAVLLAGIAAWWFIVEKKWRSGGGSDEPKQIALTVSEHSDEFNNSIQEVMDDYYSMTEAFVVWDSAAVNKYALELKKAIDSLKLDDLKSDTLIHQTALGSWENVKNELNTLIAEPNLGAKRAALNLFSNQLYDLLRTIRYDIAKVYLQECPMALNNYEAAGNWLSKTDAVRNPFLGTQDPVHGRKMLQCGEPKDTLNFMITDTIQN